MDIVSNNYMPGDPGLIERIVCELKSQGIFDQFRKECISDVDTKPAYQNLRQRVEGSVAGFLTKQNWSPDMNKNQVREQLRKSIYESGYLETGVERIVDQVVNPKITNIFLPKVEDVVYQFLGLDQPNRQLDSKKVELKIECPAHTLLPTDLEAISPESVDLEKVKNEDNDTEVFSEQDNSKQDEDESPPFEPLEAEDSLMQLAQEDSIDSHLSEFSGLASHNSGNNDKNITQESDAGTQDSRMSLNSSESHLSIVTSDGNSKLEESVFQTNKFSDFMFKSDKNESESSSDNTKSLEIQPKDDDLVSEKSSDKNYIQNGKEIEPIIKDDSSKNNEKSKSDRNRSDSKKYDKKSSDKYKSRSDNYKKDDKSSNKDYKDKDKKYKEKSDKDRKSSSSSKSRDSSRVDKDKDRKEKSSSKNEIKSDSKRDKDKNSKEGVNHKDKEVKSEKTDKDKSKTGSRDKESRDKDKKKESSSSSSKDRSDKSSKYKSSSSDDKKDTKLKEKSKSSLEKSKDKHSESSKDKKRSKSSKDDHYSSKDKRNHRRSTDRDSDGQSNRQNSSSSGTGGGSTVVTPTQKSGQESTSNLTSGGSGDSGTSDAIETVVSTTPTDGQNVVLSEAPVVMKLNKPKFASNIHEAIKLMKIRKQLKKLEKENQLSLVKVDITPPQIKDKQVKVIESKVKIQNVLQQNSCLTTSENAAKIVEIKEVVPPLKDAVISQARWDALEAKLLQQVGMIDYNSYESPEYDDYDLIPSSTIMKPAQRKEQIEEKDPVPTFTNVTLKTYQKKNLKNFANYHVELEPQTKETDNSTKPINNDDSKTDSHTEDVDLKQDQVLVEANKETRSIEQKNEEEIKDTKNTAVDLTATSDLELESEKSKELSETESFVEETVLNSEETETIIVEEKDTELDNNSLETPECTYLEEVIEVEKSKEQKVELKSSDENIVSSNSDTKFFEKELDKCKHIFKKCRVILENICRNKRDLNEIVAESKSSLNVAEHGDDDDDQQCRYLSLGKKEQNILDDVKKRVRNLEESVEESSLKIESLSRGNTFKTSGLKRKYVYNEKHVDLKNNNMDTVEVSNVVAKRPRKNGKTIENDEQPELNAEISEHTDISVNDSFMLPLSPADSDKSIEKKEPSAIPLRPVIKKRVSRGIANQRYCSDDLYKPRFSFSSSRRRSSNSTPL